MHRWRYPTLSLHGIQGAFDGEGSKTVIPGRVVGKFSLRIVPDMTVEAVDAAVRAHLEARFAALRSPNQMTITTDKASLPWYRDPTTPNFAAAAAATRRVHGVEPCLTREGGSLPITLAFEEACDATCVLLPLGASDDAAHAQNEKLDRANYVGGIKKLGVYLDELAHVHAQEKSAAEAAAEAAASRSRAEARAWRRRCKFDPTAFGCDCLECQ